MPLFLIFLLGVAAVACFFLTGKVRKLLEAKALLDLPNYRSSHQTPTPRGGGLALIGTLVPIAVFSLFWFPSPPIETAVVLALITALAIISWHDDVHSLSPLTRLVAQGIAVLSGLIFLPDGLIFQGFLPFWLDRAATLLLWVWFINLFNFMDGIDGITAIETICICTGLSLIAYATQNWQDAWLPALTIAVTFGFLLHNWHPARIFLGDVGSIPLGFLLGWFLLSAAASGFWVEALILPAYYLTDATITLLRRLLRGEKIWQAHREHFYQKAAHTVGRHDVVTLVIVATNILLLASMIAATFFHAPLTALVCACLVVFGGMRTLHRLAGGTR